MDTIKQTLVNFVAEMVLAINEDRKTQTRRVVNPQPPSWARHVNDIQHLNRDHGWVPSWLWQWSELETGKKLRRWPVDKSGDDFAIPCPFGHPGDRIGVRERARVLGYPSPGLVRICYMADGVERIVPWPKRLRPVTVGKRIPNGCHREAVRTWTEITAVRAERLNEISNNDACAEGTPDLRTMVNNFDMRDCYRYLWEKIYGPGTFDDRWVWVTQFKRVTP